MTAMPTMRNIANNTPANAVDVDWNFETIETHVDNELVNRDGSVAMTAELLLAGNPSSALAAAPKQYVDASIPAGVTLAYAGTAAPTGWLLADGSVVSQATYAALYAVCGTTYNTGGEGAGNFRLPNLKTRVPTGRDAAVSPFTVLGASGGNKDATLVTHSHTVNSHTHSTPSHQHSGSTGFVSNDHSHGFSGTTAADGTHQHGGYQNMVFDNQADGATDYLIQSGPVYGMSSDGAWFTDLGGSHTHSFSGNTGGISANHNHAFTTNNDGSGTSGPTSPGTDSQGSSATNANLSPYLVMNYIIKT